MIGYILGGLALFGLYEGYKHAALKVGPLGGFTMTPGHMMQITYSGAPSTPPTRAQAQAALDASAPGLFDLVADPQAGFVAGTFFLQAVYTGPAQLSMPASELTSGWTKPNSMVVASVQDMGGAPQTSQIIGS